MVIWTPASDGTYMVADAIRIMLNSGNPICPDWPKVVWNNNVPSKTVLFHLLALKKSILVRNVLSRRHILPVNQSSLCIWCLEEVETIDHLLTHCKWSFRIWAYLFHV
ncbi:uncharacterized protein [Rutidosis leptorrhynchoides]|uniref:uncharacterized protein n=1 Tax=Rutidosis leptorrhynchoides TaxID=125765 RepID=UPI003A9A5030